MESNKKRRVTHEMWVDVGGGRPDDIVANLKTIESLPNNARIVDVNVDAFDVTGWNGEHIVLRTYTKLLFRWETEE